MGEKKEYRIFEEDINRVVDVYDTTHSQTAVILPPIWLLQQKMWEPYWLYCVSYYFSVNIFLISLGKAKLLLEEATGCSKIDKYGQY